MKEVTKEEFKKIYFKYGKSEDGWNKEYWNEFYQSPKREGMKYMVELPESISESRMMIVDDYGCNEYRLFFFTIEQEEAFFDNPGKT